MGARSMSEEPKRYYIDTEFIERPGTIDLISIGIVSDDDRELYCVSSEFDGNRADPWVKENVISKLDIMPRDQISNAAIATKIRQFIGDDTPEFWGYYCDYDWVAFCWLFGRMVDLPDGWPMYCNDLKQLCDSLGNPNLPMQEKGHHNALEDAKWNMSTYSWLKWFDLSIAQ